jgi:hypothetical protein
MCSRRVRLLLGSIGAQVSVGAGSENTYACRGSNDWHVDFLRRPNLPVPVARAIRGAKAAGLEIARVEIDADGTPGTMTIFPLYPEPQTNYWAASRGARLSKARLTDPAAS